MPSRRARNTNRLVAAVLLLVFAVLLVLACYHQAWGPAVLWGGFTLLSLGLLVRYR